MSLKALLNIKDAAEYLQMPVEEIIRLVNSGILDCWKLGGGSFSLALPR